MSPAHISSLPSVFELLDAPHSKAVWKDLLNKSVNSVIEDKWRNELEPMLIQK